MRRLLLILGVLVGGVVPSWAQTEPGDAPDFSGLVKVGDEVAVRRADGSREIGRVEGVSIGHLVIAAPGHSPTQFSASDIARISRPDSHSNGKLIGALIGSGAGLAGAAVLNTMCTNEGTTCPMLFVVMAGAGAGIGAGIGAVADAGHEVVLYRAVDRTGRVRQLSFDRQPEFSIGLGAGSSRDFWATRGSRPQLSGAFRYRADRGVGYEIELANMVGADKRFQPCVRPYTYSSDCLATGEETLRRQTDVTGLITYTLPRIAGRIQPYVGAGAGFVSSNVETPRFDETNDTLRVFAFSDRAWHATGVGGLRIDLGRGLSVSPSVTMAAGQFYRAARFTTSIGWRPAFR